jgi:putative ABC transport system permease protein
MLTRTLLKTRLRDLTRRPAQTALMILGVALGVAVVIAIDLANTAARAVTKAISRTSVAIASLMVAVSVTIGVSLMIDSFRATVINWLDLTLRADVYISAGARLR